MGKIISFDEKISEMNRITICENSNQLIALLGPNGMVIVELNPAPNCEMKIKKNIFQKLKIFKSKNLNRKIKEVTEKEANEIFLNFVKDISWQSKIPDNYENIWEKVKKKITEISNFRYAIIEGNPNDSVTIAASSIFIFRNSIH